MKPWGGEDWPPAPWSVLQPPSQLCSMGLGGLLAIHTRSTDQAQDQRWPDPGRAQREVGGGLRGHLRGPMCACIWRRGGVVAGCSGRGHSEISPGRLLQMPKPAGASSTTSRISHLWAICRPAICFLLSTLASLLTQPAHKLPRLWGLRTHPHTCIHTHSTANPRLFTHCIYSRMHAFVRPSTQSSCEPPALLTPSTAPPRQNKEGKIPTNLDVSSSEKRNLGAREHGGR